MKPLLVGERLERADKEIGFDGALLPFPGKAGGRLAKMLRMEVGEYLRAFERVNLIPAANPWNAAAARMHAESIERKRSAWRRQNVVVLLGRRVAWAFGLGKVAPFSVVQRGRVKFVVVPHPSGRCRAWNKPSAAVQLRTVLRVAGVPVPVRRRE